MSREEAGEPSPDDPVWVNTKIACAMCDRAWVATHPFDAKRLECPGCGYMNAVDQGVRF